MEGSDWVALVAVMVTGVSIYFNYRGSGKRLEHDAKLLSKRLAHERREASLAVVAKAYRLSTEVQRTITLATVEHWAANGVFTISVEAKASVIAAVDALELASATGWSEEVRAGAGLVLIRMMHFQHSAFATVGALQRSRQGTEVEERFTRDDIALTEAISQFQTAIAAPVTQQ